MCQSDGDTDDKLGCGVGTEIRVDGVHHVWKRVVYDGGMSGSVQISGTNPG